MLPRLAPLALLSLVTLSSAAQAGPPGVASGAKPKALPHASGTSMPTATKVDVAKPPKLKPPKYVLAIQFVATADDDGGRSSTVTRAQAEAAVQRANAVFRRNGGDMGFTIHGDSNFGDPIESTALNRDCIMAAGQTYATIDANTNGDLNGDGQIGTGADRDMLCDATTPANARTAFGIARADRIIVFSRGGNDKVEWDGAAGRWKSSRPTGGQSGGNMAYVRMPESLDGGTLLAHELGHYFANPHTFREGADYNPADEAAARARMQAWAAAHPSDDPREAFNGDGLTDTPYDPRKSVLKKVHGGTGCETDPAMGTVTIPVTVNGTTTPRTLTPDRANVMSYFKGCAGFDHRFSAGQIARMHAAIAGNRRGLLERDSGCYSSGSSDADATTEDHLRAVARKVAACMILTRRPMPWEEVMGTIYSQPSDLPAGFTKKGTLGVHVQRETQLLRRLRMPGIED